MIILPLLALGHFTWAVYVRRALFSPLRRRFGALEPLRLRFFEAIFIHTIARGDPHDRLDDSSRQQQHSDRSRSPHCVAGEAAAATSAASGQLHAGTSDEWRFNFGGLCTSTEHAFAKTSSVGSDEDSNRDEDEAEITEVEADAARLVVECYDAQQALGVQLARRCIGWRRSYAQPSVRSGTQSTAPRRCGRARAQSVAEAGQRLWLPLVPACVCTDYHYPPKHYHFQITAISGLHLGPCPSMRHRRFAGDDRQ